ncbi:hypothetical protein JCM11641_005884 [Rhodosporidiobolus odoratus]
MYYQYNPTAIVAGNQHRGHATSDDLYHWKNQPGIDNVLAFYTLNTPEKEVQNIAYSLERGYTFENYEGNPVIDSNTTQFRDPKVTWHAETERWVMTVAYPQIYSIAFYTSTNLRNYGAFGLAHECPHLIELPIRGTNETRWVRFISINLGWPQGGSAGEYFIGDFDVTTFTPKDAGARLANFGKDMSADHWFYGTEEPISIACLPRLNATRLGLVLGSIPYQLDNIRNSSLLEGDADTTSVANKSVSVDYSSLESGAVAFSIDISLPTNVTLPTDGGISSIATLNLTFVSSATNESLSTGHFFGNSDGGFA